MIVQKINNQPDIPESIQPLVLSYVLNKDGQTYTVVLKDNPKYTLSKLQVMIKLEEMGLEDAVLQFAQKDTPLGKYVNKWLQYGNELFRWDEKTIALGEALNINLDAFFEVETITEETQ